MSIIADALKKARTKEKQRVAPPPPFELGREGKPAEAPGRSASGKPAAARTGRKEEAPTRTGAPRPKPVQEGKKAKAAKKAPAAKGRRWSVRVPAMFTVILLAAAGIVYYVNEVYLPGMQQSGIQTTSPPMSRAEREAVMQQDAGQQADQPGEQAGRQTEQDAARQESTQQESTGQGESAASAQATQEQGAGAEAGGESGGPAEQQTAVAEGSAPAKEPPPEQAPAEEELIAEGEDAAMYDELDSPAAERAGTAPVDNAGQAPPAPAVSGGGGIVSKGRQQDRQLREDIYHFNMAVYFQRRGDVESALVEYAKVIDLSPNNAEVYCNMGALYNQIGEYDKAVAVLQKALLIDPAYSKAHNNMGLAHYRSGHLDLALASLNRAVELEPANLEAYNNLGLVHRRMDQPERAEKSFMQALSVDPDYAAAHYNLAVLYDEQGRLRDAISHYRSFISLEGGSGELRNRVQSRIRQLGRSGPVSGG